MDDSCMTGSLQGLKGKAWSSLQHLMVETSDDSDDCELSNGNNCSSSPMANGELSRSATSIFIDCPSDTMKLKREDMPFFGQRPAWDPFYLVVCEHCDQVIKPQALRRHIELRHSSSKSTSFSNSSSRTNSARQSGRQSNASTTATSSSSGSMLTTFQSSHVKNYPTLNEPNQNSNSASNSQPASSNSSNNGDSNLSNGVSISSSALGTTAGAFTPNGESNLKTLLSTPTTISIYSPQNDSQTRFELDPPSKPSGKSNSTKTSRLSNSNSVGGDSNTSVDVVPKKVIHRTKLLPCKDRKYDSDRHCGVRLNENDQPCTRSLTCKTHSLTLRRAVQGRSDLFDTLLNQHRMEKEAVMRAAGLEVKPTKQQLKQQQKLQKEMQNAANKANRAKGVSNTIDSNATAVSMSIASTSAPATPVRSQLLAQLQSPVASSVCPPSLVISPIKQTANSMIPQPASLSSASSSSLLSSPAASAPFSSLSANASVYASSHQYKSQMPTTTVYGQPMHSSMATAIGIPILSKPQSDTSSNANNAQNKLLLQKLNGKLNSNRASLSSAAQQHLHSQLKSQQQLQQQSQQQQSCASDLLFGCEENRFDSSDLVLPRQQEQLLLVGCQPRPAAVCTFNARQLRIEPPTHNSNSTSILSSRLFDRKRDFTYSALAVFRSPSTNKPIGLPASDEVSVQSDSLQSNSNQSISDLNNSNSASLHSTNNNTAATDKCFVNMFANPVSAANLFSNT